MVNDDYDVEEAMFLSVIYSFHAAAMQQMGKLANPLTGKIERNLGAARGAIDTLMVLQKRTKGNLTDLERRTLSRLIQELQLNYVDEAKRPEVAEPEKVPEPPEKAPEPARETPEAPRETAEKAPEPAAKEREKKAEGEKKPPKKRKPKSAREKKKPRKKKE